MSTADQVYGGPSMQAYTAERERQFAERQVRLLKVGGGERLDVSGRVITSPLVTEDAIDSMVRSFQGPMPVDVRNRPEDEATPTDATLVKLEKQSTCDGVFLVGTIRIPDTMAMPKEHKWISVSVRGTGGSDK